MVSLSRFGTAFVVWDKCRVSYEDSAGTLLGAQTVPPTKIHESSVASQPLGVDREKGVIFGVKCLGRESKNGRTYSQASLGQAVELYENGGKGTRVNIDHTTGNPTQRGMLEGFGILKGAKLGTDGVSADLHYLKAHPLAEMIVEQAERFPEQFGLSHVALGEVVEGPDGSLVVESLEAVESVDIVQKPATNAGLFEQEGGPTVAATKTKTKKTTVRQILEANKKHKLAAQWLLLCEEEEFVAAAEAPVEMPAEELGADDQVKAAFRSLVMAAFDDDALDAAATINRIKEILKAQEKLEAPAKKTDATSEGDDEAMAENVKLKQQLAVRDALDEKRLSRADLSEVQLRVLDRSATKEDAVDLIEAWGPTKEKPRVGPKFLNEQSEDEGETAGFIGETLKRQTAKAN